MTNRICKALPGALRLNAAASRAPQAAAGCHRRTARIIGADNGMGLSRDRQILADAFRDAGWAVLHGSHRDRAGVHCAINVHLETLGQHLLCSAAKNIVIPNPEWWLAASNAALADPSIVVWAKTQDAANIFAALGAKVEHMGFSSVDRQLGAGLKTRTFLHIAGASPNKGTLGLIAAWQADWPWLYIVSAKPLPATKAPPNVRIVYQRLSDAAIRKLQNEHLFHIYPSEYEGFGHAQWEGLSCGAIVFATNAPPFDEQSAFHLLDSVPIPHLAERRAGLGLARHHKVLPDSIASAAEHALMLRPDDELSASCKSRKAWEKNDARFNARLRGLIAALDMPSNCSSNSPLPAFTYIGRVNCVTGQGSAARHQIHILRQHGFLFRIIDAGSCVSPDPRAADPFIQAARQSDAGSESTCGTIVHLQPNTAEKFHRSTLYPRPHILVSVWETTKLPKEWVASINSYDQVWCATQWQFDIYRQSGIKASLLRLVPFSLDPSLYMAAPTNQRREKIFGSVFQWSERKDPECLIGAYLDAFAAADPVQLILKSYEGDSPTASISRRVEAIVRKLRPRGECPKISIVSSALDSAGMSKFYAMIDCYVSAHRGEGFGLPIAEALLYGRPVIATDWSAPAEYAAGLFRGVKHALQPPHNMDWQPFYSADQLWAQADRADMAAAMREAASGQVTYDPVLVRERFGVLAEQAGNAAKDAIRELLS